MLDQLGVTTKDPARKRTREATVRWPLKQEGTSEIAQAVLIFCCQANCRIPTPLIKNKKGEWKMNIYFCEKCVKLNGIITDAITEANNN